MRPIERIEGLLEAVRELGLGYLELLCEPGFLYPQEIDHERRAGLRRAFQVEGIKPTIHATFYNVNLASLNPLIREASLRQLLECLQFAHDLEAEVLVVHAGDLPSDYPQEFLPLAQEKLLASLEGALKEAEGLGVTLALENKARGRNRGLIQSQEEHLSLIEALGSPRCRIALDLGHAHTFGLDLQGYLKEVLPYLAEVHLHDNDGSEDQHRPLGEGTIPFRPLLSILNESFPGPLILEMMTMEDLKQSLSYLQPFGIGPSY
ncbi:MAG: sugar phosphate isomerase/epimerase family protein [Candidatus Bipolaricaulia bacterium]